MSSTLLSTQAPTIDNTLGAVFLGAVLASILYGITTLQVWLYYHRYFHDSVLHQVSVGALWALDTLHQALIIHTAYVGSLKAPGSPKILWYFLFLSLSTPAWSLMYLFIRTQVDKASSCHQRHHHSHSAKFVCIPSLDTDRLNGLRFTHPVSGIHHGYLGYLVALVVGAGFGVVFSYEVFTASTFVTLQNVTWSINASLAASTTIDFTIGLAMCYYLRKSKEVVVFQEGLNSKLTTVMQYMLTSGLLTSAISLSTLFTYNLMPDNLVFLGLQFMLTKFYTGSFLAMLNARQYARSNSTSDSQTHSQLGSRLNSTTRSQLSNVQLHVQTSVHTHLDHSYSSLNDHLKFNGVSGFGGKNVNGPGQELELTSPSSMTSFSPGSSKYPSDIGTLTYVSYDDRSGAAWKKDSKWDDVESEAGIGIESPASAVVRPALAYDDHPYISPANRNRERSRPDYAHHW
ncbi:hypothetical protein D9758_009793 [Tetrapyrgos nigripes]|uniref:DUF6534 domain-containing protein n=1 Tax=Tetrapyrgos nigripes TaxID=182062 RepID=A0A8H5LQL8_9AGAR|nr:hypothetical protein D9758_009793 [Tetrapyrgos nigripes]